MLEVAKPDAEGDFDTDALATGDRVRDCKPLAVALPRSDFEELREWLTLELAKADVDSELQ